MTYMRFLHLTKFLWSRHSFDVEGPLCVLEDRRGWVTKGDLSHRLDRVGSTPVSLKLADELSPALELSTGLSYALQCVLVSLDRSAANCVDNRIDIVPVSYGIQRGKDQACFGPQRAHDEFLSTRCLDGFQELLVFPSVDGCPVKLLLAREDFSQWRDGRFLTTLRINGGQDYWKVERFAYFGNTDHVIHQKLKIHGRNSGDLRWLIIDKHHSSVLRC